MVSCNSQSSKKNAYRDNTDIKNKIENELVELNHYYNRVFQIEWADGPIAAHPPNKIKLNLLKIKSYINQLPNEEALLLVRLILAHEFVHLLQDEKSELNSNGQQFRIRILESQADILAARYAILKHYQKKLTPNQNLEDDLWESKFTMAYEFFFTIGAEFNNLTDHPTRYQRASSIYRGAKYARTEILGRIPNAATVNITDSIYKRISKQKQQLNLVDTMNSFEWSLSQAELICHGNPIYMANIVRTYLRTEQIETKDGKIKFVIVHNRLINDGKEDVNIILEARIAPFRCDTTSFFDKILFVQNKYRTIQLNANYGIDYVDTFLLPNRDRAYELVVAPDTNSLYSISAIESETSASKRKAEGKRLDNTIRKAKLSNYIEKLNAAISVQNISRIITSFGMPTYRIDDIMSARYEGVVPIMESFKSDVSYNLEFPGQYQVRLTFITTQDSIKALKTFSDYALKLKTCLTFKTDTPKEWRRIVINSCVKKKAFKSQRYPNNINELTLEHVKMPFYIHPFNMIKGESSLPEAQSLKDYYIVCLTIRQWPDWSKRQPINIPL